MSFTSVTYFLFVGISLLIYTIVPKRAKWCVLLGASAVYYVMAAGLRTLWLVAAILIVYGGGLLLGHLNDQGKARRKAAADKEEKKQIRKKYDAKKRTVVTVAVLGVFGLLIALKYVNFLGESAYGIAGLFGSKSAYQPVQILLPLGISYYTLCAVSYVVDVYRGKYKPERNFFKLALFLSFFPQMTEGPIGKYEIMMPRLVEGHSFDFERDAQAVMRIFWGMFKKMVIADRANLFVTGVFDNGDQAGSMVLLGTLLYTVQIYCEFSGCMDIVCATGQLFGVEMQENFRRPIFSKTINEFWQRWHITLGAWIKEYVFFSVSLSKGLMNLSKHTRKKLNDYFANLVPMTFALFCVWFFNGIWHGASWKYVLYGLYYYILMMIGMYLRPVSDKLLHALHIAPESKGFALFQMVRTFLIVNVGMMLFRCHTITQWGQSLARIFTDFDGACLTNGTALSLGNDWQDFLIMGIGVLVVGIVEVLQEKGHTIRLELARRPVVLRYAVFLALIIGVIVFGAYGTGYETVAPIYGQF